VIIDLESQHAIEAENENKKESRIFLNTVSPKRWITGVHKPF
jgi:hypothetical protein